MTDRIEFYDQSKIPDTIFDKMKELKDIEDRLVELYTLIDRKNDILDMIESEFPSENGAIAVKEGLTIHWKLGKRSIGNPDLNKLESISPRLVRTIAEKVIPSERKAETLTNIEKLMEYEEMEERLCDEIYDILEITQSKSLIAERI